MKRLKKTLIFLASLVATASLAVGVACGKDSIEDSGFSSDSVNVSDSVSNSDSSDSSSSSSSSSDENENLYAYRIKVQTEGGYGISGVKVTLSDGENTVAVKTTSATGYALFKEGTEENMISQAGEYEVTLSELPAGYALANQDASYTTEAEIGTTVEIAIKPTGVIKETAPAGKTYKLGDVMYDFTITTSDDNSYTLSEVLKEKKAVLINFWATWCGPCKMEFPALNSAYYEYRDTVSVLAMSTTDSKKDVAAFKSAQGLFFDMAASGGNLTNMFNTSAIPYSVLIDRFGAIAFMEAGSMTNKNQFTEKFALLTEGTDEEYEQVIIGAGGSEDETPEDGTGSEQIKPDVEAPAIPKVHQVLGGGNQAFDYSWNEQDEYSWPWLVNETDGYLYTPNKLVSTYAELYVDFTVNADTAITFDYLISSELDGDMLYVLIDEVVIHKFSGIEQNWKTCLAYVFDEDEQMGEHRLSLIYLKDGDTSAGDDEVKIKNLRLVSPESLVSSNIGATIFKYAATNPATDESATAQFNDYITPVLYPQSEGGDGYYHVGAKDGPILFANLLFESLWSETSVWLLAYSGYCTVGGNNLADLIEEHSWVASNNMKNNGYVPVTEELAELLKLVTAYVDYAQKWDGDTHDNEWLELCVYYQPYGNATQMEDPTKGISFHAAIPMNPVREVNGKLTSTTSVSVPFAMKPRGFKYKFTPTTAGAYHIYSVGTYDTVCFLVSEDKETFLGTYSDQIGVYREETQTGADGKEETVLVPETNFSFYYYFEANKTYYMLFTTYLDVTANYDVVIDYLGESYTYMANAAVGPYSANLNTFELYLPDAIEYYYDETNDVYRAKSNNAIIYLDCNKPTAFFSSISLYDICRQAMAKDENNEFIYPEELRAFYIDGKDYTADVMALCFEASNNTGALEGYIKVTQEVFDILQKITVEKYDGIYNSWLMLCYYELTLAPQA